MPESASIAPEQLLAHVEWVRRLAATLVADDADADDVAQETPRCQAPPHRVLRAWHRSGGHCFFAGAPPAGACWCSSLKYGTFTSTVPR